MATFRKIAGHDQSIAVAVVWPLSRRDDIRHSKWKLAPAAQGRADYGLT
jgi:hypothetical protein